MRPSGSGSGSGLRKIKSRSMVLEAWGEKVAPGFTAVESGGQGNLALCQFEAALDPDCSQIYWSTDAFLDDYREKQLEFLKGEIKNIQGRAIFEYGTKIHVVSKQAAVNPPDYLHRHEVGLLTLPANASQKHRVALAASISTHSPSEPAAPKQGL